MGDLQRARRFMAHAESAARRRGSAHEDCANRLLALELGLQPRDPAAWEALLARLDTLDMPGFRQRAEALRARVA
jgi:hypothetical protein